MEFSYTPDEIAWRDEVRAFFRDEVSPELVAEQRLGHVGRSGPEYRKFRRAVGARGWFGLNWPTEYGGMGLGPVKQQILADEFAYLGLPGPDLTVTSVAPTIMRYGTEANKRDFLPGIARGDIIAALGYSEPDAGSDLASLRTSAVRDGDWWVVNGTKIWNSNADIATHEWLAVRTEPDAPERDGISVIMVPMDTSGISVQPLQTWSDYRTNLTTFDDVRVPAAHLIGERGKAWGYIHDALTLERSALTSAGDVLRLLVDLKDYVYRQHDPAPDPAEDALVDCAVGLIETDVELTRLLSLQSSSILQRGGNPLVSATCEKVFSSEMRQRLADVVMDLMGGDGLLTSDDPGAPADGAFEQLYRAAPLRRFGGGANEILRDLIARRACHLPSVRR